VVEVDFDFATARVAKFGKAADDSIVVLLNRIKKGVRGRGTVTVAKFFGQGGKSVAPPTDPIERSRYVHPLPWFKMVAHGDHDVPYPETLPEVPVATQPRRQPEIERFDHWREIAREASGEIGIWEMCREQAGETSERGQSPFHNRASRRFRWRVRITGLMIRTTFMMTLRPDPHEAVREPIRMPPLLASHGSLSPMEKSLLGYFIILSRPKLIVEIGVYRAITTRLILDFLRLNEIDAQVVGFDMPDTCEQLLRENGEVRQAVESGRLRLVGGELPSSLRRWVEEEKPVVDLALLDARHDFPSVDWELKLLWPCLSSNGYILGHDYTGEFDGVRYAFDHFASKVGAHLLPLESRWPSPELGRDSVLVALRRPVYRKTLSVWFRHRCEGWRADFVRSRWTGPLWQFLRQHIRRAQ